MLAKREDIFTALFAKLSAATFTRAVNGSTTFKTSSRRIKLWGEVPVDQRPAMFMVERHEVPSFSSELEPAKETLHVDVFVYTSASGVDVPSSDLNVILDALDATLKPLPSERKQTLGGLVSHCRQEGQKLKDPGDLDNDGLIIYPIKILTT